MNTSKRTRNAAWRSVQPMLGTDGDRVLRWIKHMGKAGVTDGELFRASPVMRLASIVRARNRLVKKGLVRSDGTRLDRYTKRIATVWVAVKPGQGELF